MRPRLLRASSLAPVLLAWGCALLGDAEPPVVHYRPARGDYAAFRFAHPEVLEPNYLPFMVHPIPGDDGLSDWLVFCRWSSADMPLRILIEAPAISDAIQDEFDPEDPADYVEAVQEAFAMWEEGLEGLVTFRRVSRARDARLRVRLIGEEAPAPEPELQVLGVTRMGGSCRRRGRDPDADRLEVRFEVPEIRLYLADQFGLLDPDQVEWIALHEIGHALGMRTHSPIPADLMYEVVRDRVRVRELSDQDVNSFVSLYRLPNGTVFKRQPRDPEEESLRHPPPSGPPVLALAPHVDPLLGYAIRPPRGWLRIPTAYGVVAVDGVSWDHDASFQVIVQRYPTIEAYLARFARAYLSHGYLLENAFIVVNGRRALHVEIEDFQHRFVEEITFIETGDGRVIVILAEAPVDSAEIYKSWFEAALATLEITSFPPRPGHPR